MKLGLHNFAFIMPIENSCFRDTTLHKNMEFYTEWFSVCPNITSAFRKIAAFKSFGKEKVIQIKRVGMSVIIHCTKLHLSSARSLICLHKTICEFYNSSTSHVHIFVFYQKCSY
jgi:hypothetical protein